MSDKHRVILGVDSGSTSVNIAVVDAGSRQIIEILPYERHNNKYESTCRRLMRELIERYDVAYVNMTGNTGKLLQRSWPTVNRVAEIEAQAAGIRALGPDVAAVIDGGGSEVKFFKIAPDGRTQDFAMNPECAAGSGNFLDVQANRLELEIDDDSDPSRHFPTLGFEAVKANRTVPISGRCSVFAKTDMIHQQQKAVPVENIVGGVHESLINNLKATVIQHRLRGFTGKVSFQGGLSQNASLRFCLAKQFSLEDDQLLVHEWGYATGAIGAAMLPTGEAFTKESIALPAAGESAGTHLGALTDDYAGQKTEVPIEPFIFPQEGTVTAYVGIDVGSVSTNVVFLDGETEKVIVKSYLPTRGRPIEAMKDCFRDCTEKLAEKLSLSGSFQEKARGIERRIEVAGVCTTGSGRFMTGYFCRADIIKNEITGQAVGAVRLAEQLGLKIDTIFEIGGQDSKYIKLDKNGHVRDYTMNKVCAAGCGSFLEEQAEKLMLSIKDEFADVALSAPSPSDLGDRCTVFIASVLDNLASYGEPRENLVAGLAYSVASNYLNRVVEGRDTEDNVFFQGGTAFNTAVVRAFQKIMHKPVMVTPHNEVTGAVGAAFIVKEEMEKRAAEGKPAKTGFDGIFETVSKPYESAEQICGKCPNRCELQVVKVTDTYTNEDGSTEKRIRRIYYGDRCDEMNLSQGRGRTSTRETWISRRNKLLFEREIETKNPNGKTIAVPRTMSMWSEHYAFWKRLFCELGFTVRLGPPNTKATMRVGSAESLADFCVPIRTAHGAVKKLLESDPKPDYIFIPHIILYDRRNMDTCAFACVWTQTLPIAIKEAFDLDAGGVKLLDPVVEFEAPSGRLKELVERLSGEFDMPKERIRRAIDAALDELDSFRSELLQMGREALKEASPENPVFVIVGRPYNSLDAAFSLDIATKVEHVTGLPAVPMDFLDLEVVEIGMGHENMYWKNGERIISAFRICAENDGLVPLWITNFGCGPDSFIRKQVRYVMGERPYLELELDEHTADAGVITRIEAFYDSYKNTLEYEKELKRKEGKKEKHDFEARGPDLKRPGALMVFSYIDDGVFPMAAVFRSRGVDAVVLPQTSAESLAVGKRYTSGKECVPFQTTLGDKLCFFASKKKRCMVRPGEVKELDREVTDRQVIFYDPFAAGPCRFGLYNEGYKRVYEQLGLKPKLLASGAHNNYADVFEGPLDATKFALLAWDGICASDVLHKTVRLLRLLEVEPGASDRAYHEYAGELVSIVEQPGTGMIGILRKMRRIVAMLHRAAADFSRITLDRSREIATVSLFGEIYVRSEPFINEFLIRRLEEFGIRSVVAPMNEWIQYVNRECLLETKDEEECSIGDSRGIAAWVRRAAFRLKNLDSTIKHYYLPRRLRKLSAPFRRLWDGLDDPSIEDTLEAGMNLVPFNIHGELILSWGLAREIQHNDKFHGLVNIGPFGCMPSKVMTVLLHDPEITKPVFDANYDGTIANTRDLKIETFASEVVSYARSVREKQKGKAFAEQATAGQAVPADR